MNRKLSTFFRFKVRKTFVIILVFVFLLLECFSRMKVNLDLWELTGRAPTTMGSEWSVDDAFSAYKGKPMYSYEDKRLKKTINEFGFISTPSIRVSKPVGGIRIVFLGESSTAGTGFNLSNEDTWPWQTVEIIKKKFPHLKVDFINAGTGGYTSFESYGRLWSEIRFFNPDVIIVYHGWNEIYYFNKNNIASILNWRVDEDGSWNFNRPRLKEFIEPIFLDHIFRYSRYFTVLRAMFGKKIRIGEIGKVERSKELSKTYDKERVEVWRTNLQLIKMTAKLMGAKLFVCKEATLVTRGLSEEGRKRCSYHFLGLDHNAIIEAYNDIYRVIDEEIDKDDIIDVTTISGNLQYFEDQVHPNKVGARKIAHIVSRRIISWLSSTSRIKEK